MSRLYDASDVFVRVRRPDGTLEPPQSVALLREPGTGDYVWLSDKRRVEIRDAARDANGRLNYLIAVDRPAAGPTRASDAGVLSVKRATDGVEIEVTARAAETIIDHGGKIYLWQTGVGGAWLRDRLSFDKPPGVAFHRIAAGLISVLIAEDVARPESLKIRTRRLIPGRIEVEWDGKPWGRRGDGGSGG